MKRSGDKYEVTLKIAAQKLYADGTGVETEAPLGERAECAVARGLPVAYQRSWCEPPSGMNRPHSVVSTWWLAASCLAAASPAQPASAQAS